MEIYNTVAKEQYYYNRYWIEEIQENPLILRRLLNKFKINKHYKMLKCKTHYYKIPCGFDIETSTINNHAYMYIWQFSIGPNVIIGRTWEDLRTLLKMLQNMLSLTHRKCLLVLIHNLNYEFSFFRKEIGIIERGSFLKDKRQPLKLCTKYGIEFRDSMALTHTSLERLARDYTNTQKAIGDIDYSILRNSHTPLTEQELSYCCNDVLILSEYADYIFNKYGLNGFLPLTITGILRHEVADNFKATGRGYQEFIKSAYPESIEFYNLLMFSVYRGGYTHANMFYVGDYFKKSNNVNIYGYDFTSSYPAVMCKRYFPHRFEEYEPLNIDDFEHQIDTKCVIFVATFKNLKATGEHSLESSSKCLSYDKTSAILDNGRIRQCDLVTVALTELDYLLYKMYYKWDSIEIYACYTSERIQLPNYLIEPMLKYYTLKAELKDKGKNYALEKSLVNSFYGLTVTRLQPTTTLYNGEDFIETSENFDFDKERKKATMLPQWGVYVSAHARFNLMSQAHEIEQAGASVLYMDTDSIKVLNPNKKVFDIIEHYNQEEERQNKIVCDYYKLDYNIFKDLGCWDLEFNNVTHFITLGAKRYLITNNHKFIPTVAGLPKKEYVRHCKQYKANPYTIFKPNLFIEHCKTTAVYFDEPTEDIIEGEIMRQQTSVTLKDIDFKMRLDNLWLETIANYTQREVLK